MPDVTPKTESGRAVPDLSEAVNDLLLLLPGSLDEDREINAAIGIVVAAASQEAASKAVAEVRRFTRHLTWCGYAEADRVKEWIGGCTCGLDAALIASERTP